MPNAKSLPLYLGGLLVAAAIAGAIATLVAPTPEATRPARVAAPRPGAVPTRTDTKAAEPSLSPEQVRAQDEEDIMQILLVQIKATPASLDPAWFEDVCVYVTGPESLAVFWSGVIEHGRVFDADYTASHQKEGTVLSHNPLYYVFEAREFIHTQVPEAEKLLGPARGLLDMAIYRSWQASRDALRKRRGKEQHLKPSEVALAAHEGAIGDDVKTAYFQEILQLYQLLSTMSSEAGQDPRYYMPDLVRLHEAALLDRWLLVQEKRRAARQRYRGTSQSSAPATVDIARWEKAIGEHLLSLGKIYIDAAQAERAYRSVQEDYTERGFKALAMVFQRNQSHEALRVLREANRIQRYHLWQMARVARKQALAAVAAGRQEEAKDAFLLAKERYLQCLARLERSKKPSVLGEYRQLQAQIDAWIKASAEGVAVVDAKG